MLTALLLVKKNLLLVAGPVVLATTLLRLDHPTLPYTVETSGLIMPVSEWTLSRAANGNLVSALKDNRTGKLTALSASVFQRGTQANFHLHPRLYRQATLAKGDTVGSLFSNQDHEQLVQLQGQLAEQQAELRLVETGQKPADVESTASQVALARQELAAQRLLTQRTQALYHDSLASRQEYEAALNQLRVRELTVQLTGANLRSASTGGRPEQRQVIRARIRALRQQIQQINHSLQDRTLVAPVAGTLLLQYASANPTEEVLVAVADNSAYVALLPVAYTEKEYVRVGQGIEADITGTTHTTQGTIIGLDNTVQMVDGRQAFFVTALLPEKSLPLVPGMVVRTRVFCQPLSVQGYVARFARSLFLY
ncbi:hypothetical protein E5K00_19140 [Hymenobacter aquaticus]|uniref:HlyD family efflux transporter periplasmic adaptor subunit n=1 Tax=Hymenobacter aquaticus TaxID=1867101 RepID=A0A4Z0PYH4_9BACT|nr:hypothetical protein [Hymenobacter aquaticus]TGE22359.1 hypothetical protein E5K00_19140 [Hymenobacter aquaticus]